MHFLKTPGHNCLGTIIQSTGCLIQQKNRGTVRQCTGNQETLPLPTGYITAAFTDHRIHAHGHLLDVFIDTRPLGCQPGILHGQCACTNDIRKDIPRHQLPVLQNHAHLGTHRNYIQLGQILPIIIDGSRLWLFKPQQQSHQCRLAATGTSHDCKRLARFHLKGNILQHIRRFRLISKAQMTNLDGTGQYIGIDFILTDFRFSLQDGPEILDMGLY